MKTANGIKPQSFQFTGLDGRRKTLRLGRVSDAAKDLARGHVAAIVGAASLGNPVPPQSQAWLRSLGDRVHGRLARTGVVEPRAAAGDLKLKPFLDGVIAGRTDLKPRTLENLKQTRRWLVKHFGPDRDLRTVNRGEAKDWVRVLKLSLSTATVAMHVKKARQFFADAVDRRMMEANPFAGMKAGSQDNPDRMAYVPASAVLQVIGCCPDAEWKLIFALARFAALRIPSESSALKWTDVRWDWPARMTVRSPKTEHHAGRDVRVVPIGPELMTLLRDAFEAAPDGAVHVIARHRGENLRTTAEKIIRRAGLSQWPKLFQNLRSSMETDWTAEHPLHVACGFAGNTQAVAVRHYLQVTEKHFEAAAGPSPASPAKSAAESAARSVDVRSTDPEHQKQNPPENPGDLRIQYPQGVPNHNPLPAGIRALPKKVVRKALRRLKTASPSLYQQEIQRLRNAMSAGGGR